MATESSEKHCEKPKKQKKEKKKKNKDLREMDMSGMAWPGAHLSQIFEVWVFFVSQCFFATFCGHA